jgi:hypothetical protein
MRVGVAVGISVGISVGFEEGENVGYIVGSEVGFSEGKSDGAVVGLDVVGDNDSIGGSVELVKGGSFFEEIESVILEVCGISISIGISLCRL